MNKWIRIVLGVVIFSFLMFSVFYVLDPLKTFAKMRDEQRNEEMQMLVDALKKYSNENNGVLPVKVPVNKGCDDITTMICKEGFDCDGVNLGVLVEKGYIEKLPIDPLSKSVKNIGYSISYVNSGRVRVCSPYSEVEDDMNILL